VRLLLDADAALATEVLPVVLVELGTHLGTGREAAVDGLGEVGTPGVHAASAVHGAEADGGLAGLVVEEVGAGVAHADRADGGTDGELDAAGRQVVDAEAAAGGGSAHAPLGGTGAGLRGGVGGLGVGGGVEGGQADGQDHSSQEQS